MVINADSVIDVPKLIDQGTPCTLLSSFMVGRPKSLDDTRKERGGKEEPEMNRFRQEECLATTDTTMRPGSSRDKSSAAREWGAGPSVQDHGLHPCGDN